MFQQQQQKFTQLTSLAAQLQNLSIGLSVQPFIPKGFLKLEYMPYQSNVQQLAQLREIYISRLNYFKTSNRFIKASKFNIQDICQDVKVPQVIGLFKRIETKRVRAFQNGFQEKYQFNKLLYTENDDFELEDQTGKIRIDISKATYKDKNLNPEQWPYGLVVKCQGDYKSKINKYIVKKIYNPKFAPYEKLKINNLNNKCILTVNEPSLNQLNLLKTQFINNLTPQFKNIVELIIIGGLNYYNMNQIKLFDCIIAQLGQYVDTFIVPSSVEYKQHLYPLKPYHKCLLKQTIQHKDNVALCSNPQILKSAILQNTNLTIMVSCGENLQNLKANCSIHDQIQLMKMVIRFGHMCPSSAFSLPIQSYNIDPLLLKQIPHLMINGKSKKFNVDQIQESDSDKKIFTRLVALRQGDMALIDLSSNKLETTKFNIQ